MPAKAPRRRSRGDPAGFTLVEIMTIVVIIALLLAIALPSINRVRIRAMESGSYSTLYVIETGCRMYYDDLERYPSSDAAGPNSWQGRNNLVLALTGFLDLTGDGASGFGFRTEARGTVYGPYNGTEKIKTKMGSNGLPSFVDSFDQPFYYYRFDPAGDQYNPADNGNVDFSPDASGRDVNYYTSETGPPDKYLNHTFVLMTRGSNEQWDPYRDNRETDDITNFVPE